MRVSLRFRWLETLTKRFQDCYLCCYEPRGVVTVTPPGGANRKSKTIDRLRSLKRKKTVKRNWLNDTRRRPSHLRVHFLRVPPTLVRAATPTCLDVTPRLFSRELTLTARRAEVRSAGAGMILVAWIFLLGRKPSDPTFNFSRKLPCSHQGDSRLDPTVVSHGKWFYPLAAGAISYPCATAPVSE